MTAHCDYCDQPCDSTTRTSQNREACEHCIPDLDPGVSLIDPDYLYDMMRDREMEKNNE